ncbi:hypothetical protein ACS0TY_026246 [Phlomoides rotata]
MMGSSYGSGFGGDSVPRLGSGYGSGFDSDGIPEFGILPDAAGAAMTVIPKSPKSPNYRCYGNMWLPAVRIMKWMSKFSFFLLYIEEGYYAMVGEATP